MAYRLELVDEQSPRGATQTYPSARFLGRYAEFCAGRGRLRPPRMTLGLYDEADTELSAPLGWLVGVTYQGRFDALPDRMYGVVRARRELALDLDLVFQCLRRDFGGKFTVNFPPEVLAGPYGVSYRSTLSRYHAYDTFVLRASSEEEAWERLERVGRQGVRKAEKEGVQVNLSTDGAAWMRYLGLHVAKNARYGSPVMSRIDIDRLRVLFGDDLRMAVATRDNIPLASVFYVLDGEYAMLIDNASLPEHWYLNPNNLVVWEAVRDCIARGARVIDYGFSAIDDEGAGRFKAHMGAERVPVYAAMSS